MLLKMGGIRQKETVLCSRKTEEGEEIRGDDPSGKRGGSDRIVEGKRREGGDFEELGSKKIGHIQKGGAQGGEEEVGQQGDEEAEKGSADEEGKK